MNRKTFSTLLGAGLLVLGLSACGEYPQVKEYKPGNYAGKTDTRPWEGGTFKGDKTAWEHALKNRGQNQNEYKRTGG